MKNKAIKVLSLIICILFLSGCGQKNFIVEKSKDNSKKEQIVYYEKTGQTIPTNILCRPTDKKLLKIYEEHDDQLKVSIKKLPECKDFKIGIKNSKSIWEGLFIKPLAFSIIKLGGVVKNYGVAVILIGLLIRILLLPASLKTQKQTENMKKINPEIQKIEKKYANQTTNEAMMAKSQEMMMLYKKYNVSPFSSCLLAFIQLPLFLAFLQAINRVPVVFEGKLLGMSLGMTPLTGLKTGKYIYIVLILLIILTTYLSLKKALSSTSSANPEQAGSMKSMLYVSIGLIVFTAFNLSTAIGLYWVSTNGFIAIQNYVLEKIIEKNPKKRDNISKSTKKKSIKEKVEKRR
jgi:YidC/Oxa1 family membrane protein insertase